MKKITKRQLRQLNDLQHRQYEVTLESQSPAWIHNLKTNAPFAMHDLRNFSVPKSAETCLIFAPGASLQQYEDKIHELKKPGNYIVGSPTVVPWMMRNNLPPDCVVAVDAHDEMHDWLKLERWRGPVIMPTQGNTKLASAFDCWFFNVRHAKKGYVPFMDVVTECQYPEFFFLPSVGHATGHALQIMMVLTEAGKAHFKRYVLVGADYGYWQGVARVPLTGSHVTETVNPEETVTIVGVDTNYKMAIYAERLYMLCRSNADKFVYLMAEGILDIPKVEFADLLQGRFPLPRTEKQWVELHEHYLLDVVPRQLLPVLIKKPWWKEIFGGNNAKSSPSETVNGGTDTDSQGSPVVEEARAGAGSEENRGAPDASPSGSEG